MIYCDTSLLVSVLVRERFSEEADAWMAGRAMPSLAFSGWTDTEVASALARKHRIGEIDAHRRGEAAALWADISRPMRRLSVEAEDFRAAIRLVDAGPRGLRSGDALHLAIVKRAGYALATLDRDLADAAEAVGVAVALRPPA